MVAHECILDLRGITKSTGVTVDDVAKRLADYGFHAPTMSFPVAGTLMVEPTESESLTEIDAFCEAMIAIRGEIDRVGAGEWPAEDNPLRGAPHTAECLVVDKWEHPVHPGRGRLSARKGLPAQGVAAGAPHRRRLRGPQPDVLVPTGRGLRLSRSARVSVRPRCRRPRTPSPAGGAPRRSSGFVERTRLRDRKDARPARRHGLRRRRQPR